MKNSFAALGAGFLFAVGLGLSGMTQPRKVIGFLDFSGLWDPSLAFVMAGAIAVHLAAYQISKRWRAPLYCPEWHLPSGKQIPRSMLAGAAIFGIGWGLAGYCPGPALVSLASGARQPLLFVASMLAAMLAHRAWKRFTAA